jgi:hypothetical protein
MYRPINRPTENQTSKEKSKRAANVPKNGIKRRELETDHLVPRLRMV